MWAESLPWPQPPKLWHTWLPWLSAAQSAGMQQIATAAELPQGIWPVWHWQTPLTHTPPDGGPQTCCPGTQFPVLPLTQAPFTHD